MALDQSNLPRRLGSEILARNLAIRMRILEARLEVPGGISMSRWFSLNLTSSLTVLTDEKFNSERKDSKLRTKL